MEIVLVTSSKDSGLVAVDINSGIATLFKDCVAESGCLTTLPSTNSYSGSGSVGDYIAVSQSKKPVIHIWQWDKPSVLLQCHQQEILTSLVADTNGNFVFGGSKTGRVYAWEISTGALLFTWQAHFKAITRMRLTLRGDYLITAGEDGVAKAWEYFNLFGEAQSNSSSTMKSLLPYRAWTPHTLPIKDLYLLGSTITSLRILTCSHDKHLVMYDFLNNRICARILTNYSLECLTVNQSLDTCYIGTTTGTLVIVDLSISAYNISAAHSTIVRHNASNNRMTTTNNINNSTVATLDPISVLSGHTKCITSLAMSLDNRTLITGSEDGTLKVWDTLSRQCVKDISPVHKNPITNVMLVIRPEILQTRPTKWTSSSIAPLKKYSDTNTASTAVVGMLINSVYEEDYSTSIHSCAEFVEASTL